MWQSLLSETCILWLLISNVDGINKLVLLQLVTRRALLMVIPIPVVLGVERLLPCALQAKCEVLSMLPKPLLTTNQ